MRETEVTKSVWLGKTFISIGDTRIKGNQVEFKKLGGLFSGFVPVLANANDVPYQERKLWVPGIGDTTQKVKVFMSDLMLDKYYSMLNPQQLYALTHLQRENEALHQEIERLFDILMDASNEDRWKKRIKKEMDHYNSIKGYGGGNLGGMPSFGAFGGGGPEEGF